MSLADAVKTFRPRVGIGALISTTGPGGGSTAFLGSAHLEFASGASFPGLFSPALEFSGTLVRDGAPGVPAAATEWSLRIVNRLFVNGAGVQVLIGDFIRAAYWIGSTITLYMFVDDAGTWQQHVIAVGFVKDYELTETHCDVRCVTEFSERREAQIPKVFEDSMNWDADEGNRPEGQIGNVSPWFYGSFTHAAVLRGATFPLGTAQEVIAAQLGFKFPMLPLALLADKYRRPTSSSLATTGRQILMCAGRTNAIVPKLMKLYGNSQEDTTGSAPPADDWWYPSTAVANAGTEKVHLLRLYTWDDEINAALPFAKDQSTDMDVAPTSAQKPFAGGGCWTSEHGAHTARTNFNTKVQSFYIERIEPDWAGTEPDYWMGGLQSAALPARKLNQEFTTTATLLFKTTTGVTNPLSALDEDLTTYASVPNGDKLCVTLPSDGPRLGEVMHVRLNVLLEVGSTSSDVRLAMRYIPQNLAPLSACWLTTASGMPANVVQLVANTFGNYEHHVAVVQKRIAYSFAGHGHNQWDFSEFSSGSPLQRYAWDVLIWPNTSGTIRVIRVWLEVIYKPRLSEAIRKQEGTDFAWEYGEIVGEDRGGIFGPSHEPWANRVNYTGGVTNPEIRPTGGISIYASGRGPRDDLLAEDYLYFGGPIETAPQMLLHWLDNEGLYSRANITPDSFGSFKDAHDALDDVLPLTAWGRVHVSTEAFANALGPQSKAFFRQQPTQTSPFLQWRAFVDSHQPNVDFPERMYQNDTKKWGWNDLDPASFRASGTKLPDIRNRFVLRYGFHEPTRSYAYERVLDGTTTTLATEATIYKTLCSQSVQRYGTELQETIDAPWIWWPTAADTLLKWHADLKCNRRVTVSFRTYLRAYDLLEGHVIRFDDEIGLRVPYPGFEGSASWSAHMFNVVSVKFAQTIDGLVLVDVDCVEVYKKAT